MGLVRQSKFLFLDLSWNSLLGVGTLKNLKWALRAAHWARLVNKKNQVALLLGLTLKNAFSFWLKNRSCGFTLKGITYEIMKAYVGLQILFQCWTVNPKSILVDLAAKFQNVSLTQFGLHSHRIKHDLLESSTNLSNGFRFSLEWYGIL